MSNPTPHVQRLIAIAKKEYADWHKFRETDPPLENHIRQYCRDLRFGQFDNIQSFQWSATFISWCFLQAGATDSEFHFSEAHAVFVHHAIQNAEAGTGVFRGWPISDYAPQLGDLIHGNQPHGTVTFEYARTHSEYHSHSAIIVDLIVENGVRYAVTIGGNESQTVGMHHVELTADGKVKQKTNLPYISVVQNLKVNAGGLGLPVEAPTPSAPVALAPSAAPLAPAIPIGVPILHPLLENDPVLRQVAAGQLSLQPTGQIAAGVGAVHDALALLARTQPQYTVDLGPNHKYRGYYGPQTARVVRQFQQDNGLEPSGNIDRPTLVWLSHALNELKFQQDVHEEVAATGEIIFKLRPAEDAHKKMTWYATVAGGKEFYVGREVTYHGQRGLENDGYDKYKYYYDEESPEAQKLGHWRYVLAPTGRCESGGMLSCINTYDPAWFTFGFYQFTAHVPGGDFIRWLRALLRQVTSAPQYFPDLALNQQGHIVRKIGNELRDLEVVEHGQTRELMRYFNPSPDAIEDREVLNCARLIHWTENDVEVRQLQLLEAVNTAKEKMIEQNTARPFKNTRHPNPKDFLCVAIIDIIHHEGSKYGKIDQVLKSEPDERKALKALCAAGIDDGRNKKLLDGITKLITAGKLGTQSWSDLKV